MKRKIKITDKLTKDIIKVGDIIRITIGNIKKQYKVVLSYGGQIQMDGMDSDDSNNRYFISSGSFDRNEIEGKRVNKAKNPELLQTNPKEWENFFTKINDFEVIRNGEVIDAVEINGKSSFTPKPEPVQSGDTSTDSTEITSPEEVDPQDEKQLKKLGKKAMEAIINDPQMKAAFYRQPSFWRLFSAEMTGDRATGKGILPALDLVGKYMDKQTNKKVGSDAFKNNKIAKFIILDDINLTYQDNDGLDKTYPIGANTKSEATNTRENLWDDRMQIYKDYKILSNKKTDNGIGIPFKIAVKKRTKTQDVFICRFIGIINNRESIADNVNIRFIQSNGYDKTQLKNTKKEQ
jgi:hypothetical protein